MAEFISIQEAMNQGQGEVIIRGWVHRERGSNKIKFIILRDSTNIIQCVIEKSAVGEEEFKIAKDTQVETSMTMKGEIKKSQELLLVMKFMLRILKLLELQILFL